MGDLREKINTERQLRHVDLCSGIGGFSLGFEWAGLSKPILFCDTEEWCRKILAKNFPNVPIATDVKELANDPERLVPDHDILTAGYPCQPFSVAGKQKGSEDDRHIWPYIFRIIAQKRPTWCVFENVYGHIALGLDKVLFDLESEGYSTRTFIVPACGVNAPHRRDRLWIIARIVGDTKHNGSLATEIGRINEEDARRSQEGSEITEQSSGASRSGHDETLSRPNNVAYSVSTRLQRGAQSGNACGSRAQRNEQSSRRSKLTDGQNWLVEPNVGRVAHGIPRRVDRLKGLGNAIVPQIAMNIGLAIKEQEDV
jgi:DNA (cytosine-5)-methyltransferase 1